MLEVKSAADASDELSDTDAIKIIEKLAKQVKDSADIYTKLG